MCWKIIFCDDSNQNTGVTIKIAISPSPSQALALKSVLRSWSEPRFFGWSRSRFKILAGAGADFFGSAAPFFGK